MSSLFQDGGCSSCKDPENSSHSRSRCNGSVCDFFRSLEENIADFCNTTGNQQFILVTKGDGVLNLGGTTTPTLFRFVTFDSRNCTAVLSYDVTVGATTATRNLIIDCRSIAGVSCVNPGDLGIVTA